MNIKKIMRGVFCMLAIISLVNLITGCTGSSKTYIYSPPTSVDGMACVDECKQAKASCDRLCRRNDPQCIANAQEKAEADYEQYVDEQEALNKPVRLTKYAFYHPNQCINAGCGCASEYNVCYQLCGTRTEAHNAILARE